ncbi:MAG: hypothetical protein ACWA5X_00065 [bacterium]
MKLASTGVVALAGILMASSGVAKEITPLVGMSVKSHSNISKIHAPEVADTIITPYAGVKYKDVNSQFESSVDFRLNYETYADNTFDDRALYEMDGYVDFILDPGRLTFSVEDYAGQYRINIQDPDSPSNIQNINVLAAGPDLLLARGAWDVLLKARLANVIYSETADDNTRVIGAASLRRSINSYSSLSVDSTLSFINYNADFFDDYNVVTTGLSYYRDLPYGSLKGSAGYNGFHFDNRADKNDPYYDLSVHLDLGGSSSADFVSEYKLTDLALDAFNPLYTRLLSDFDYLRDETTEKGASGVYRATRHSVSYTYAGSLTSVTLLGYFDRKNYFSIIENNFDDKGVGANISYTLSERVNLYAGITKSKVSYKKAGFDVDVQRAGVGVSYNLREDISILVGAQTDVNESDEVKRDYSDTAYYVQLEYKPTIRKKELAE